MVMEIDCPPVSVKNIVVAINPCDSPGVIGVSYFYKRSGLTFFPAEFENIYFIL
jgi:hypothetical protein